MVRVCLLTLAVVRDGDGAGAVHSMTLLAEPMTLDDHYQCVRALRLALRAVRSEGAAVAAGMTVRPGPSSPPVALLSAAAGEAEAEG